MTSVRSVMLHAYDDGHWPEDAVNIIHYRFPVHKPIHVKIDITYISVAGGYLDVDDEHVEFSEIWAAGVRIVDYTVFPVPGIPSTRYTPKSWGFDSKSIELPCIAVTFALVAKFCEVYARGTIFLL